MTEPGATDLGHEPIAMQGDALRVLGHPEVLAVVTDPATYSSAVSRFLQVPNGMDGDEHRAYRDMLDRHFTAERLAVLEQPCREIARALVADLPRGVDVDVVGGLGTRYAVRAMLAWLGWPADLEEELVAWVGQNAEATRSKDLARTSAVAEHYDAIIERVVEPRLARLADEPRDVTDELLREEVDGRRLSHDELVSVLRNWTGGDLGSLALCIGVVCHQLAARPDIEGDVRARRAHPAALDAAIDELLRIDDPFVSNRRVATTDAELGGCPVHAGQRLVVDWTRANRDPRVFADPHRYDPEGNAAHNLVYGAGPHVCPGRGLATLELRVLLEELLDATSEVAPAGADGVRAEDPLGGWAVAPVVFL